MQVIGLTGGIGSGKSEAARTLERLGASVVSADLAGHAAYRRGSRAWREIVQSFGESVIGTDGEIDRKLLGAIVFSDRKRLERLNAIVWPEIRKSLAERIALARRGGEAEVLVIEAAVLLEAGWDDLVDEVWVIDAPESALLERLVEKGLSPEQARARLKAQLPSRERLTRAAVVIRNDRDLEALERAVRKAWDGRIKAKA
ncbi:MAG: dephospho-CoA kinase [Chloroflexi bacterium]|nr:dephospho-CoA kinase [Chloroflexota bacterium]